MKLAVIDHVGNQGGASRFVRALLPALRRERPSMSISYFGNPASIEREDLRRELSSCQIDVVGLNSLLLSQKGILGFPGSAKAFRLLQSRFVGNEILPTYISGNVLLEIEQRVRGFDLAFFPWPFMLKAPRLACPVVATFHDLNFKYYFSGAHTFSAEQVRALNAELPSWLDRSTPVVSTYFMEAELAKFYPQFRNKLHVAHLAPMSIETRITGREAALTVETLGLVPGFILCPTHLCGHKNIGPLISAVHKLNASGNVVKLVLTGSGTERIVGAATSTGVLLGRQNPDVVGLGYVTNHQMDSLIHCAAIVVNPSLYEAGNGPGVDAWIRGTPVAMSDIPAFREHIDVQGIRAKLFDPNNANDIAAKLAQILEDPALATEDAAVSRSALERLTWATTARRYLEVFDHAISAQKPIPPDS